MPEPLTPDFSASPRKRFELITTIPYAPADGSPFVLYTTPGALDGTATLDFTPWQGAAVTGVPVYQAGKFDLALMKSLEGQANMGDLWAAY
jgi:hypothetical protein